MKLAMRFLLGCSGVVVALPLCAQTFDLALDAIEHPAFSARQITLHLVHGGAADLDIGRLSVGTRAFGRVRLRCGEFAMSAERISCRRGQLRPLRQPAVAPLPLEFSYHPATKLVELELRNGELASLVALLPELAAWHPGGHGDARLSLTPARTDGHLALRGAAFGNAAGTQAGDKIDASLAFAATRQKTGWTWQAKLDWPRGELYMAPLYRSGAMSLAASGQFAPDLLAVDKASLTLDGVGSVSAALRWQPAAGAQAGRLLAAEFASGPLDLATLAPQFVQPFIDTRAGSQLTARGTARLGLAFDADGAKSVEVDLDDATLAAGSHALEGIQAHVLWRRDAASVAQFHAAGGKFGALPLGAFDLPLAMRGYEFDLPRVEIPLLDGKLLFEDFHAARVKEAWQWRLAGALEPVSMPLLTQALGWPKMTGLLSATIPRISYADATLTLDGQMMVSVFDGYLAASGLKVVDPFGRLPRLQVDFQARHLDLGMLTETFSFGDITGYIDGDVKGLEMSGLRPLAFDAHIRSTPGDYRKRISQRAVQNISSLGGAGAGAAIQRSFLHFFNTFGYDEIGLSCRLVNDICEMGGVAPAAPGYLIVKGGGIPALNVIGYNRRVHWDELVERLQAVIAGNSKAEIR